MFGGGSIQLARVYGIRVGVDPSWFFVLFLVIWLLSDYFPGDEAKAFALAVVSALAFFLSILLHELGHAVVAIRNGIGISGIDLWMFGGVAKMERDTDSPGLEFKVAVAGPLVTLAIAAVCFAGASLLEGSGEVLRAPGDESALSSGAVVLGWLALANASVLVLNLIPGFPLDGGRIVRAIAWWRTGDRNRATRFAATLGRGFGYVIVGLGVLSLAMGDVIGGIWLMVIGFFLAQAARSAEAQSAVTARLEGLRVSDVMDAEPVAVQETLPLDRARDEFFLRYGWPWFPTVDASGHLTGLVNREAIDAVPEAERPGRTVASVAARDSGDGSLRVRLEDPLEALLGREALSRLGAVMAVDAEGVLRGVVTVGRVRRALRPVAS